MVCNTQNDCVSGLCPAVIEVASPSGSIKRWEFLEVLHNWRPLE
jgi:hypothetical protein